MLELPFLVEHKSAWVVVSWEVAGGHRLAFLVVLLTAFIVAIEISFHPYLLLNSRMPALSSCLTPEKLTF